MSLLKAVEEVLESANVEGADILIVGVSGGPDSMLLADILRSLGQKMVLAHVNYGLRGQDSELDEKLVRLYAAEYDIPLEVKKAKLTGDTGLEEKAREIRYKFFQELKRKFKAKFVVTAHNLDDQAETIVFNFLRGTFLDGLSGMEKVDFTQGILRPLLDCAKAELMSQAKQLKVPFRVDKSNIDTKFSRNLLRHKILPEVEKQISPKVSEVLSRNSAYWRELSAFIKQVAMQAMNSVVLEETEGSTILSKKEFMSLPNFLKVEIIKYVIDRVLGGNPGYKSRHYAEIFRFLEGTAPALKKMPADIVVKRDVKQIIIAKES